MQIKPKEQPTIHLLSQDIPSSGEELLAIVLTSRGIPDSSHFLHPKHPSTLTNRDVALHEEQIGRAVTRIQHAIANQETVVIAGDYDADGICATATLWLALQACGLVAQPFIPDRLKHGYGLNERSVEDIQTMKPDLVITVDNGIVAQEAVAQLAKADIAVVVSDHHEVDRQGYAKLAQHAVAIIHTTQLCGAGVAWFLAKAVIASCKPNTAQLLDELLDLVGIATIADQVPLLDANRSFAVHGLRALQSTQRMGLVALFEQAQIKQAEIDERTVGFQIAPRINALGRLAHGLEALRLLVSTNSTNARKRAQLLHDTNQERQVLTSDMYELALEQVAEQRAEKLLIVHHESFHEGIIGLIAGRCVEASGKPCIAIAQADGFVKGSVRSVTGFHVTDFLRQHRQLFIDIGGHAMAAGFSAETAKLAELVQSLQEAARIEITEALLSPTMEVICKLPEELVNLDVAQLLQQLRPYGQANPEPLFLLENWKVLSVRTIGKQSQHRKYLIQSPSGAIKVDLLHWNVDEANSTWSVGSQQNFVCTLNISTFRNTETVSLVLKTNID